MPETNLTNITVRSRKFRTNGVTPFQQNSVHQIRTTDSPWRAVLFEINLTDTDIGIITLSRDFKKDLFEEGLHSINSDSK